MMKINSRALNKNEMFCCSKKDVKNIFGESELDINFGYFHRDFDVNSDFYRRAKIQGKIIASMHVSKPKKNQINDFVYEYLSSLQFYVLKKEEYSEQMRVEFVTNILSKIYKFFLIHKDDDPEYIGGIYNIRVELFNNKYFLHESIES